ncbi:2-hydroxyacyl-CoA dehydratase [Parasporobacterium paucivorans]|uniref:CoA-substrate-specific enzyme activase, putative n=1 Tax=Parasporobacterium paucivorans DSM 15970 TaxID=1122934 RepID=A0A1M6AEX1_9FIRM|nr:2-hydroxyacyl-CoA dehydratase [Parasporobacterium paucivorans]SHI35080.1 CoA-substrate-specific enzyme activase, putative [Parasporobacterium paucivorans DSM 15970]
MKENTNNTIYYKLGVDIGSTTVKISVLDKDDNILFSDYKRHFANIQETLHNLVKDAADQLGDGRIYPVITGSGGLTLSKYLKIPFVQEVVSVSTSLDRYFPHTDVAIELGGEDAKIIYFTNGVEQRMNGICAGGTGSFIDQMASLLQTDAAGLNDYAKNYKAIYPIAARCGVFAKSDIQPLINEGATKEDLSASIFQAVVNQTISGLACGKPIRGNVAFLGGPLHFLSELKNAFVRTLKLTEEQTIAPENSHLFAAIGAALSYKEESYTSFQDLTDRLSSKLKMEFEVKRMDPLFASDEEYEEFVKRHSLHSVATQELATYIGKCYLGIDAGSTTTKVALVSEDGNLLYSFYNNNNGSPLLTTIAALREIHEKLPPEAVIAYSCSTGYGEALIKSALMLDEGEVETVAHYYAASFFEPDVDCILDIGGQDMKYIRIRNGAIENVLLNEACSSGCGSFIEAFAKSLNYSVKDFAKEALKSRNPIDLGSRCTVFMNSNVKQAQKEGASVADISAGLAYSVIKNALFKVIKITDPQDLGNKIVVQGGTFYNNAVLRSFEQISGRQVIRPDIAGIMGAFGAALIARERFVEGTVSTMIPYDEIDNMKYESAMARCKGCTNSCLLTINKFNENRKFIIGNRCEIGVGKAKPDIEVPNLFKYKNQRLFDYDPLPAESAPRGVIGIPRVLNMFENYPFWAVFFKSLGFSVVLSPESTHKLYELGMESIPSESECYPAKLAHGHVQWLINNGIERIFYPCIPYERDETQDANNHYNCPIVTSYPENIKNNVEEIYKQKVKFYNPFMAMTNKEVLENQLVKVIKEIFDIPEKEIRLATLAGWNEMDAVHRDIQKKGEEIIAQLKETGGRGIVLAGRPYHVDPEINHGIPDLVASYGFAVFTEDAVSHLQEVERPLIVMDQWMYHSRLYSAANYVKTVDFLDLIQLNSFGCGLDAVTTDCVSDVLSSSEKIYTVLKIDEVNNLGAARIRIRSLIAALKVRNMKGMDRVIHPSSIQKPEFTEEMRKDYTILCPQMSPIHFDLLEPAFNSCGLKLEVLENDNREATDMGLKYVNNDACYPSLIVVGQVMEALLSGKYDLNKVAVIMSQTGGGCRASNYIGFIRRALRKAGMEHIPVISLSAGGYEKNSGFKITPKLLIKAIHSVLYGDVFMKVLYRMRPYEKVPGSADALHEKWKKVCINSLTKNRLTGREFGRIVKDIIQDFDNLPITDEVKPRVGIVGEILVKFLPLANNYLVELLEAEGAEAVMPDLIDFLQYSLFNSNFKSENLGMKKSSAIKANLGIALIEHMRKSANKAFSASKHFTPSTHISKLAQMASKYVSTGNQTGEGWFLTGEMLELIHSGVPNIVCAQPFACLPNHIVGKGVIKELRYVYPESNIVAVDYDPGASEVNQLNRIKLMLATANKNLMSHKQIKNK